MSSDLLGCYALDADVDAGRLRAFLDGFGLKFSGVSSCFKYDEGFLGEASSPSASWSEFEADMHSASASLIGTFSCVDYRFSLGFWGTQDGQRYSFFSVSGRQIDKMSSSLEKRGSTFLHFFVGLRSVLNARGMAFGMDIDNASLVAFLRGELPLPEVDQFIVAAAGVPPVCAQMLRSNPRVREIAIGPVTVLSRWLPGLDNYFKTR
jgi:hypothetical protein